MTSKINSTRGDGRGLDPNIRTEMEGRFGADFSNIRIHIGSSATSLSRELNARAFTVGSDIYFDERQFQPDTEGGKHLLAHELAHSMQRPAAGAQILHRKTYEGKDDAGVYKIDDQVCTMDYSQDWYFDFGTTIAAADQPAYMASGKRQVEDGWKDKYKLIADNKTCPCDPGGFKVNVLINTFNQARDGKHGYTIDAGRTDRGHTVPPTGRMSVEDYADKPYAAGGSTNMDIMSHEFGHTIGLPDEYTWLARLFGIKGSDDPTSLMNVGNDVKPWHYQHFADMLNFALGKCTYYPTGGARRDSMAEPVGQIGITTGAFFNQASLDPSKAEFIVGINFDMRLSNNAVLGLFYPTFGFDSYWNAKDNSVKFGPTAGLRLNRLAHPLYLDISTGVLFSPGSGQEKDKLDIPLSTTLGLRGKGFNAGVNYTPMFDLLNSGKYSHIVGLNLQFDL